MNASQSKTLIDAARKAREALLALDPDSIVALELWTAIRHASKTLSKEKCCFCEQAIAGTPQTGFSKKLKPRVACRKCAHAYIVRRDRFIRSCKQPRPKWTKGDLPTTHEGREALRARLAYCACGGKATDHAEDKDGNLLQCSHCDGCDHFHYQTDSAEAAA
jgi:hypothetical protein